MDVGKTLRKQNRNRKISKRQRTKKKRRIKNHNGGSALALGLSSAYKEKVVPLYKEGLKKRIARFISQIGQQKIYIEKKIPGDLINILKNYNYQDMSIENFGKKLKEEHKNKFLDFIRKPPSREGKANEDFFRDNIEYYYDIVDILEKIVILQKKKGNKGFIQEYTNSNSNQDKEITSVEAWAEYINKYNYINYDDYLNSINIINSIREELEKPPDKKISQLIPTSLDTFNVVELLSTKKYQEKLTPFLSMIPSPLEIKKIQKMLDLSIKQSNIISAVSDVLAHDITPETLELLTNELKKALTLPNVHEIIKLSDLSNIIDAVNYSANIHPASSDDHKELKLLVPKYVDLVNLHELIQKINTQNKKNQSKTENLLNILNILTPLDLPNIPILMNSLDVKLEKEKENLAKKLDNLLPNTFQELLNLTPILESINETLSNMTQLSSSSNVSELDKVLELSNLTDHPELPSVNSILSSTFQLLNKKLEKENLAYVQKAIYETLKNTKALDLLDVSSLTEDIKVEIKKKVSKQLTLTSELLKNHSNVEPPEIKQLTESINKAIQDLKTKEKERAQELLSQLKTTMSNKKDIDLVNISGFQKDLEKFVSTGEILDFLNVFSDQITGVVGQIVIEDEDEGVVPDEPFEAWGASGGGEEQVEIPSLGPLNSPRDNYGPLSAREPTVEEALNKFEEDQLRDKARMERLKEIASFSSKLGPHQNPTGSRENQEKVATREHFDTVNADEIQQEQTNFNEAMKRRAKEREKIYKEKKLEELKQLRNAKMFVESLYGYSSDSESGTSVQSLKPGQLFSFVPGYNSFFFDDVSIGMLNLILSEQKIELSELKKVLDKYKDKLKLKKGLDKSEIYESYSSLLDSEIFKGNDKSTPDYTTELEFLSKAQCYELSQGDYVKSLKSNKLFIRHGKKYRDSKSHSIIHNYPKGETTSLYLLPGNKYILPQEWEDSIRSIVKFYEDVSNFILSNLNQGGGSGNLPPITPMGTISPPKRRKGQPSQGIGRKGMKETSKPKKEQHRAEILKLYDQHSLKTIPRKREELDGLIDLYDSGKLLEIVKIYAKHKPENLNKLNQLITHPNSGGLNGLLKFVREKYKNPTSSSTEPEQHEVVTGFKQIYILLENIIELLHSYLIVDEKTQLLYHLFLKAYSDFIDLTNLIYDEDGLNLPFFLIDHLKILLFSSLNFDGLYGNQGNVENDSKRKSLLELIELFKYNFTKNNNFNMREPHNSARTELLSVDEGDGTGWIPALNKMISSKNVDKAVWAEIAGGRREIPLFSNEYGPIFDEFMKYVCVHGNPIQVEKEDDFFNYDINKPQLSLSFSSSSSRTAGARGGGGKEKTYNLFYEKSKVINKPTIAENMTIRQLFDVNSSSGQIFGRIPYLGVFNHNRAKKKQKTGHRIPGPNETHSKVSHLSTQQLYHKTNRSKKNKGKTIYTNIDADTELKFDTLSIKLKSETQDLEAELLEKKNHPKLIRMMILLIQGFFDMKTDYEYIFNENPEVEDLLRTLCSIDLSGKMKNKFFRYSTKGPKPDEEEGQVIIRSEAALMAANKLEKKREEAKKNFAFTLVFYLHGQGKLESFRENKDKMKKDMEKDMAILQKVMGKLGNKVVYSLNFHELFKKDEGDEGPSKLKAESKDLLNFFFIFSSHNKDNDSIRDFILRNISRLEEHFTKLKDIIDNIIKFSKETTDYKSFSGDQDKLFKKIFEDYLFGILKIKESDDKTGRYYNKLIIFRYVYEMIKVFNDLRNEFSKDIQELFKKYKTSKSALYLVTEGENQGEFNRSMEGDQEEADRRSRNEQIRSRIKEKEKGFKKELKMKTLEAEESFDRMIEKANEEEELNAALNRTLGAS